MTSSNALQKIGDTNKIGGILMKNAIKMLLSLLIGVVAMGIAKLVHPSWNINHLLIFGLIVFAVTFVLSLLLKKITRVNKT